MGRKSQSLTTVGATGINSCSPVGPAGYTGCLMQVIQEAKGEPQAAGGTTNSAAVSAFAEAGALLPGEICSGPLIEHRTREIMAEPRRDGEIFGHPKGLAYLAFTEMWERFSYYGMTALLALYMTKQLLMPGHFEHVVGLAALRHMFELRGPMSDVAFASLIYGWYSGLVYFTPVLGGLVADRCSAPEPPLFSGRS